MLGDIDTVRYKYYGIEQGGVFQNLRDILYRKGKLYIIMSISVTINHKITSVPVNFHIPALKLVMLTRLHGPYSHNLCSHMVLTKSEPGTERWFSIADVKRDMKIVFVNYM